VKVTITSGTINDNIEAGNLTEGIEAGKLLADKGYDTNAILEMAEKAKMEAVIPPKSNRKIQREYDKELYKKRHLVENAFLYLKNWCGIATRYAKNTLSFLNAVTIRCLFLWINSMIGKSCVYTA